MNEEKRLRRIEEIKKAYLPQRAAAKKQFFENIGKLWFLFRGEEQKLYEMLSARMQEIEKDIQDEIRKRGLDNDKTIQ